jgi:hypothetical protein
MLFTEYDKKKNISAFSRKFDYYLLKKGNANFNKAFEAIYENEHSLCLSKFLWLYYKQGHIMSIDHFTEIVQNIYDKLFFKLFFHWSWQVRNIFYYFLLYIVNYRVKKIATTTRDHKLSVNSHKDSFAEQVYKVFTLV